MIVDIINWLKSLNLDEWFRLLVAIGVISFIGYSIRK